MVPGCLQSLKHIFFLGGKTSCLPSLKLTDPLKNGWFEDKDFFLIWLIYVQVQTVVSGRLSKFFANESLGVKVTTQLASYWDWSKNSWYKQDVSNTTYTRDPGSLSSHGSIWVSNAIGCLAYRGSITVEPLEIGFKDESWISKHPWDWYNMYNILPAYHQNQQMSGKCV